MRIGPDTWIGDNSFVKMGISLGTGCIVAAGSVVVKDVDHMQLAVAKTIKYRFKEKIIDKLLEIKWWNWT